MRRFVALLGVALIGYALLPTVASAQVIYVQPQFYVAPPVVSSYYAPSVTTYSAPATYSYYPSATPYYSYAAPTYYSYSAPAPTYYSYSAPPVVTYSAPAAAVAPGGVVTTYSYYGYGIFRPRGYHTETYYAPVR